MKLLVNVCVRVCVCVYKEGALSLSPPLALSLSVPLSRPLLLLFSLSLPSPLLLPLSPRRHVAGPAVRLAAAQRVRRRGRRPHLRAEAAERKVRRGALRRPPARTRTQGGTQDGHHRPQSAAEGAKRRGNERERERGEGGKKEGGERRGEHFGLYR